MHNTLALKNNSEQYFKLRDGLEIRKIFIRDIFNQSELFRIKNLFMTEPIDVYRQLFNQKIYYYDVESFVLFKSLLITIKHEGNNKLLNISHDKSIINFDFTDIFKDMKIEFKFNIDKLLEFKNKTIQEKIIKLENATDEEIQKVCNKYKLKYSDNRAKVIESIKNNNILFKLDSMNVYYGFEIFLKSTVNDTCIELDETLYNEIRDFYSVMCSTKPSVDHLEFKSITNLRKWIKWKEEEEAIIKQYNIQQKDDNNFNEYWNNIIDVVVNLGNNNITYDNCANQCMCNVVDSYNIIINSLMYQAQNTGIFSQIDLSKMKDKFVKI